MTTLMPCRIKGASCGLILCGEEPEASEKILLQTFGFHPLAVDDALHETHVPKVDDWEQYLYIAMHAISYHQW